MVLASIATRIRNAIVSFIYGSVYSIYRLAALIEQIFLKLAGIKNLDGTELNLTSSNKSLLPDSHILSDLFLSNNVKTKIIPAMIGIAGGIFVLVMIITLIRGSIAEDKSVKIKNAAKAGGKASIMMVATPMFFIMFLLAATFFLSTIYSTLNSSVLNSKNQTVTESVFKSFFRKPMTETTGSTWNPDKANGASFKEYIGNAKNFTFSDNSLFSKFASSKKDNTIFAGAGVPNDGYYYVDFSYQTFDYFGAFIAGIFIIYCFLTLSISMVERMINLLILFFIGPAMAATIPLDPEEKRWTAWREQVFIKLISVIGNILAMVFFAYFVSIVSNRLNVILDGQKTFWGYFEIVMIKTIMTIGACIATMKGASLFVSVVSKGIAANEGTSMAETRKIMGSGLKAAGAVAGIGGAALLGKGGFSKLNPLSKNFMGGKNDGGSGAANALANATGKATGNKSGGFSKVAKFGLAGLAGAGIGQLVKGMGKIGPALQNSKLGKFISDKNKMKKLGKENANTQFRSNRAQRRLDKQQMRIDKAKANAEKRKNFMNNILVKSQQKQLAKNNKKIKNGKGKSVISL